jgi:pimeloyl-ACP methyl ester carboxylesterase
LCLAVLAGCSGITVKRADPTGLLDAWRASLVEAGDLSPRTLQTLHQLNLDELYHRRPALAYARLQLLAESDPQPDSLFALAEMSYFLGHDAERWENPHAVAFYYFCAGYAYHYLFPPGESPDKATALAVPEGGSSLPTRLPPNTFDPRFRLACDLYNAGLAKCIRAAQRVGRLDPGRQLRLPTPEGGGFTLSVVQKGFAWRPEEFGPLLFAADFRVVGLENQYRGYGLGVPLIGTLLPLNSTPSHTFYPKDVNFPVTAFFRFDGGVADLRTQRAGRLELYNPLAAQTVVVRDQAIPLETDLTIPLAYYLSKTDFDSIGYEAFLRPDKVTKRIGMYLCEPYQPGKIPVVFVHGLLSSPVTWAPLYNDLRADPVLRERFQFWFYFYPTSNPYVASAADLRQTLAELRAQLDPGHHDPALDRMVFVGHSMGGLVSKLLTIDSGDNFWQLVSSEPFDHLKASSEARTELQRVFYFQREPEVRRVIFLATPHHGSSLSPSPPAKLLEKFVRLPKRLLTAAREVAKDNPEVLATLHNGELPTSLDLLAPGAPALELLAAEPRPAGVHFHSIIGVLPNGSCFLDRFLPGGTSKEGTDGVVPYTSAHLDGVDSEIIVPADHLHVHHHPLAVQEVRRILLEHLQSVGTQDSPISQVGAR